MAVSYSFASMRIRILEGQLLSPAFMDRLINSENSEDFLAILKETAYSRVLEKEDGIGSFEDCLAEELKNRAEILSDLIEEDWLKKFIFAQYDLHNLKVLIKEELAKEMGIKPVNSPLFPFGSLNMAKVKDIIANPARNSDDPGLKSVLIKGMEVWKESQDAQALDLVVDSNYYTLIGQAAKKGKSSFLVDYAEKLADSINILSFFRAKRRGETKDFMARTLVKGGKLNDDAFIKFYSMENIDFSKYFSKAGLGFDFDKELEEYSSSKDITRLEKARDNMVSSLANKANQFREGPEVLFAYFTKVENEIKNLRIIMSAKRAGLGLDAIKERIRAYA